MNSRETNSTGDEDIIVTKAIRSVSGLCHAIGCMILKSPNVTLAQFRMSRVLERETRKL